MRSIGRATAAPPAKSLSSGLRNETVVVALNALPLVYSLPLFLLAWYLVTLKGPFVSSDPIPAAIINLSKDGLDVLGQLQKIILPTVMFIAGVMAVSRAERAQRLMSLAVVSLILLIGLAVGIDYSLFYLRREREERAAGRSERGALEAAAATSGRAVLISGVTVIVAMAGMFISGDPSFISFATGTILVVAIAVFASLTILPAMLSWLGDRVEKGRVPLLGRRRPAGESRFWTALTGRVMRRPGLSILIAGGLLVALAIGEGFADAMRTPSSRPEDRRA